MRTREEGEVRFGDIPIRYHVIRGRRRKKTVTLSVEAGDEVRVLAPEASTAAEIAAIVSKKGRWIVWHLRRLAELPAALGPREFVTGETYLYLGRQYRLRVRDQASKTPQERVRLEGGWLVVPVPDDLTPDSRSSHARALLTDWYRIHARARLSERVREWAPQLGVEPSAVLIREARRRWGSCDAKGVVRFNWRIIQASRRVVDYVVAHELAHLVHPNHSRDFWTFLGRVMPDYEARRQSLRHLGRLLVW